MRPVRLADVVPKVSLHEREVMSTLLARQATASALTEIFLLAGKGTLESPPNRRAITRFSCRLKSGECAATRDARAKALEPAVVAADALWLTSSNGKRRIAVRLRPDAFMFSSSLERPII